MIQVDLRHQFPNCMNPAIHLETKQLERTSGDGGSRAERCRISGGDVTPFGNALVLK